MFFLFITFIIVNFANKFTDLESENLKISNADIFGQNNIIQNYTPFVFHISIAVFIIISFLNPSILSEEKFSVLISDGIFQFYITLLIAIIGIINPFTPITATFRDKILENSELFKNEFIKWILTRKNWQFIKSLICLLIIVYFLKSNILVIPSLNQGLVSAVVIFFILIFIINCVIQLIKNPVIFKMQVLFRLNFLYKSIKKSFFISLGLILIISLTSILMNIKIEEILKFEAVALLVYNIVMAINEYKILRLKVN